MMDLSIESSNICGKRQIVRKSNFFVRKSFVGIDKKSQKIDILTWGVMMKSHDMNHRYYHDYYCDLVMCDEQTGEHLAIRQNHQSANARYACVVWLVVFICATSIRCSDLIIAHSFTLEYFAIDWCVNIPDAEKNEKMYTWKLIEHAPDNGSIHLQCIAF